MAKCRIRSSRFLVPTLGAILILIFNITSEAVFSAEETEKIGVRPYEMQWAGRTSDDQEPLVDFEDFGSWNVETQNMVASFEQSREEQIFGDYVAKLTYRAVDSADGKPPLVWIRPEKPIPFSASDFDATTCWIVGNNWGWESDTSTPRVTIAALFKTVDGSEIIFPIAYVNWKEWFLCHKRFSEEQIKLLSGSGAGFNGFLIQNGTNKEDRTLYFDNFAVFKETFKPLTFSERPKRGIDMFPGQTLGQNTGEGRLPFPNREETILPTNVVSRYENKILVRKNDSVSEVAPKTDDGSSSQTADSSSESTLITDAEAFEFSYQGDDGRLTFVYSPKTGTWSDVKAKWNDSDWFSPLIGGGINRLIGDDGQPEEIVERQNVSNEFLTEGSRTTLVSVWRLASKTARTEATYRLRIDGKNLVLDVFAPGGRVPAVEFGRVEKIQKPKNILIPYYSYGYTVRPAALVFDVPNADRPLFALGNIDWYRSNASYLRGRYETGKTDDGGEYGIFNGAAEYQHKTDDTRNDVFERFILSISPTFSEILPTIANPVSPWKHITGTKVWRAHGATKRQNDKDHWRNVWRHGIREVLVTDHETCWRDGGESFTFRTKPAPKKGGDDGWIDYSKFMQEELGFVYGPYNNFTDFAPVNEYWSTDMISRAPDNQLQTAWMRCYAPKPSRAVEYCEKLTPINEAKFHFSTAYCDVHSSVTPWSRTDYDPRTPGAGTFAAVYYPYGEIMLLQKQAWDGPVYSEGPHHCFYSGLTDGNYAQDQAYNFPNNPWLVDFDLLKIHDLECDFGMGNPGMFAPGASPKNDPIERAAYIDRFLAATIAFGHPGFLATDFGMESGMTSYFMIRDIAARYTQVPAASISYCDENGDAFSTSEAIAQDFLKRNHLIVRYQDGTVVVVNGNKTETFRTVVDGREIELPPNGYQAWTKNDDVQVQSKLQNGKRFDYCESPNYIFLNGRGTYQRCDKACGSGLGVCRILENGEFEFISLNQAELGFKIDANAAVALDFDGKELGETRVKKSRGFVFVEPVEGAFSYRLTKTNVSESNEEVELVSDRFEVVSGETISVQNSRSGEEYEIKIPETAQIGDRLWFEPVANGFVDFCVVPLGDVSLKLRDDRIFCVDFSTRLPFIEKTFVQIQSKPEKEVVLTNGTAYFETELESPSQEGSERVSLTFRVERNGQSLQTTIEKELKTVLGFKRFDFDFGDQNQEPGSFERFVQYRGQKASPTFDKTGASFNFVARLDCGDDIRSGFFAHPPYMNGVGRIFADYSLDVSENANLVFRADVGKRNGSDLGDGILYQIAVLDESSDGEEIVVAETVVERHEWKPIQADLKDFAGKTIRLRLITDCGKADNSSGDWGCWSRLRLETPEKKLLRNVVD